jgi:hypothetical protein
MKWNLNLKSIDRSEYSQLNRKKHAASLDPPGFSLRAQSTVFPTNQEHKQKAPEENASNLQIERLKIKVIDINEESLGFGTLPC